MNIPQYIHELLFEHNCVIVPGLGGFVASRASAVLIGPLNTIRPPHKRIAFNRNLHHNDGLLTNYIARKHQISYDSALYFVERFSNDVLKALENNRPFDFANIGKLIPRIESIAFEPSQNQNYLIDSFGLSNVNAFLIKRENKMDRLNSLLNDNQDHQIQKTPGRKRSLFAVAASLIFLIGLGFILFQYKNELNQYNLASMWSVDTLLEGLTDDKQITGTQYPTNEENENTPFNNLEEFEADSFVTGTSPLIQVYVEEVTNPDFNRKINSSLNIQKEILADTLQSDSIKTSPVHFPNSDLYEIVGGSFKTVFEASRVIEKMQANGTYATIMHDSNGGPIRISLGAFSDKKEALAALKIARRDIKKDAWLLAR